MRDIPQPYTYMQHTNHKVKCEFISIYLIKHANYACVQYIFRMEGKSINGKAIFCIAKITFNNLNMRLTIQILSIIKL